MALSQRLERAEAKASAAYVESRSRSAPALGAEWRDFDGTYAMFDGVGSPLSQTFGFGLFSSPTNEQLEAIESFFRDREAEVFHEVSPLADQGVLGLMAERGYRPTELTSVMHLRLTSDRVRSHRPPSPELVVHRVEAGGEDAWAETAARGWSETPEAATFIRDLERSALARAERCASLRSGRATRSPRRRPRCTTASRCSPARARIRRSAVAALRQRCWTRVSRTQPQWAVSWR